MISRQHLTISFSLLLLATFFSPSVSIFSGLAIAPFYSIVIVALLIEGLRKNALLVPFNSTIFLVVLFTLWAFISGFWAIDMDQAFLEWAATFLIIILSIVVSGVLGYLRKTQLEVLTLALMIAIPLAILLIAIEIFSYGVLDSFFRTHLFGRPFQFFSIQHYNRGACFLAVIFWVLVMSLSRKIRQNAGEVMPWLIALAIILMVALGRLESLSAKVGFGCGLIAFSAVLFAPKIGIRLLQVAIVLLAIAEVIIAPRVQPIDYVNKGLPLSSVHRIFIWHFAGAKAQEEAFTGYGFYSSRDIPGGKEAIQLPNQSLPEGSVYLPNHTHNSILQVWLELGYVGLALYIAILLSALNWIAREVRAPIQQAAMVAMLMSYLGISLFAFNVWQEWWVATGLFAFMLTRVYVDGFIENAPNMRGGKTLRW